MKLAIASGKGGAGKTTIAVSLAAIAARSGRSTAYVDCDVEAPNGHLLLNPTIQHTEPAFRPVAHVIDDRCNACGACRSICRFNAIIVLADHAMTFPDLCHGCGACLLACPQHAIVDKPLEIGTIEQGDADGVRFVHGRLHIGQAKAVPLIQAVKRAAPADVDLAIYDAPPGTSCPVVDTIGDCDAALLVVDPTPFGMHDFTLAVQMTRSLGIPCAAVINRAGRNHEAVHALCDRLGIPIRLSVPDDRNIATAYAHGQVPALTHEPLARDLQHLLHNLDASTFAHSA